MQLLFYLYSLKKKGIEASGEIRIPKEKKIQTFQLTEENQKEIETLSNDIRSIISRDKPPAAVFILPCKKCSYAEFCWS